MKRINYTVLLAILLICCQTVWSQNPVTNYQGVSDPHIKVFNDTIYLYSGHDESPEDKTWIMRDWRVFSSTDLFNWELKTVISPKDNYMDNNTIDCWAGDAAFRNGKYYWYFSDQKRGIGVMEANSPDGIFKDALGKPLVEPMHDPTILIDDDKDKTPYMVYGDKEGGGFHVARLNDDMISVAETPKPIIINGSEWENAPFWMDKNYIFKWKGIYYLSWGRDYAISKNIYGPYTCVDAVGNGHNLNEFAHGSFFWWKGQFYHIWCYYLKPGYKFRESIITYCHFDDEGKIVTDINYLNSHYNKGVGQYDVSWPKIEAEWYYEVSPGITKQGNRNDGFVLTNIKDGQWIRFNNIYFGENYKLYKNFIAQVFFSGKQGTLEIRTGSPNDKMIGEVSLLPSKKSTNNNRISCKLEHISDLQNLYIVFHGDKNSKLELDWIKFTE